MESWTSQIAEAHGFRDVQHNLEIFGVCADCADSVGQPAPSE